jgi:hypothetical protein
MGEVRFFERDFVQVAPLEDLSRGYLKSVKSTSLYGAISSSEHLRTWRRDAYRRGAASALADVPSRGADRFCGDSAFGRA